MHNPKLPNMQTVLLPTVGDSEGGEGSQEPLYSSSAWALHWNTSLTFTCSCHYAVSEYHPLVKFSMLL